MADLVIYTSEFPYGYSETFLETEILYLSSLFKEILIIPAKGRGIRRNLPYNVKSEEPLNETKDPLQIYVSGIKNLSKLFNFPELKSVIKTTSLLKILRYWGVAQIRLKSLTTRLQEGNTIHYSYWLDLNAFALAVLRKEGLISKVICRAHGFDLYDERGEKALSFFRPVIVENTDKIICISQHGFNYLNRKFENYKNKFLISRLGTADPGQLNPDAYNPDITIVSCSVVNPNKRIGLIVDSLDKFRNKSPNKKVLWYHIGDGPEMNDILKKCSHAFSGTNIEFNFLGKLTPGEIYEFYKHCHVDLFLNVSKSEGIPVSIMEAYSFGIPAMAPDVGGINEIVSSDNGILMSSDPSPDEVVSLLNEVFLNKTELLNKRRRAREQWRRRYNAENNYSIFSKIILNI